MKLVITTIDDGVEAERIVKILLNERLAACINVVPCTSHYWWKDKIHKADELILIIKTRDELVDEIIDKVTELHKYEFPVIEVIDAGKTNERVVEWIKEVTK